MHWVFSDVCVVHPRAGFSDRGGGSKCRGPLPREEMRENVSRTLEVESAKVCVLLHGWDLTFVLTAEVRWLSAVCAPSIPPQRPGGLSSTLLVWFIFSWRTLGKPVVPLKKNASLWYDAFFFTLKTYSNENHVFEHVLVAFFWWKIKLKIKFLSISLSTSL